MHGKRASADRAKAAFGVFRGSISCRLAFDPFKGIDRKMDKGQHRRSGVLSTHRAVANYDAKRRCSGAIADCPAKTSSFKCGGTDQGVSEGWTPALPYVILIAPAQTPGATPEPIGRTRCEGTANGTQTENPSRCPGVEWRWSRPGTAGDDAVTDCGSDQRSENEVKRPFCDARAIGVLGLMDGHGHHSEFVFTMREV
jgi:hypothetical protein